MSATLINKGINKATAVNVATGGDVQPGEIQFYEAIEPPLVSGVNYQVVATQTIQLKTEQAIYTQPQPFTVDGPRFRLQPGQVQQVYPPANQTGDYAEVLPHIVFRQRTLPWSRSIDGEPPVAGQVPTPWMALLTLYPGESSAGPQQTTVNAFLTGGANVIVPSIDPKSVSAAEGTQPLIAIELPQPLFWSIAPSLADLKFLAHARQVNTGNKEILGLDADGYFSVLIGNRFPKADAVNTVLAVSLEGLEDSLPVAGQTAPAAGKTVRLAVLASWTFTAGDDRGDFLAIMKAVTVDLLRMPSTAVAQPTPAETLAQDALQWGYVPLGNNTRAGELTTSWYRGPAAPIATADDPYGPYIYSDQAIRYDPGPDNPSPGVAGTGMFDMSYAAAWQIGRLLALADGSFATALMAWRLQLAQQQNDAQVTEDLPAKIATPSVLLQAASTTGEESHLQIARSAVTSLLATAAVSTAEAPVAFTVPQVALHAERSNTLRAGMLTADQQMEVLAKPGDPIRNLLMETLGIIPQPASTGDSQ